MTQKELVLDYLKFNMDITPAKMTGKTHNGYMFGSEISRVCRTLRSEGVLISHRDRKFETFSLSETNKAVDNFLKEWPSKPKTEDTSDKLF